ncbi:M48 family metallopeptidase [Halosimplex aquaticum]|uniref:M48 family metallopeptidase n=1 Tax=Halosimplex aquaticum TaxID=3026162 RepID=A0ABD5XU34_9EURY|nr:M48 family metallopeptidase [Halosimplex aquaticum]
MTVPALSAVLPSPAAWATLDIGLAPTGVVGHTPTIWYGEAVVLAVAAVLIGLTARDVLDGPDAAPSTGEIGHPREWLRPERLVDLVPVVATLALSVLVWTEPLDVWLWGVAVLFAGTLALAPLVHGRRLAARVPTERERRRLAAAGIDPDGSIRVVETARPTHRNGYSIGGPLSGAVGVSRAAVETLPPAQLGAVVAHERGHLAERHALVRSLVSAGWLFAGAAVITAVFSVTTPAATAALAAWLLGERAVAVLVGRATEYRADAYAARHTSPAAVADLLRTLDGGGHHSAADRLRGLLSPHPSFDRRIDAVESLSA